MTSPRTFSSQSTADQVLEGIDLTGKIALVTGASGGLGAETARALAACGARVTLTARDTAKAEKIAAGIRAAHPGAQLEVRALVLDRPDSVRAFAKSWLAEQRALHLLLNNAGVMACPLARTPEGWEQQFATNHLGHFLLTGLLAPALRAAGGARVANTSSGGHRFSPVVFEDIHFEFDSAVIQDRSHEILRVVATTLAANADIRLVEIGGHTDDRGGRPRTGSGPST